MQTPHEKSQVKSMAVAKDKRDKKFLEEEITIFRRY